MPYQKQTIGPAILRQPPQGDESSAELRIRRQEDARDEMLKACRDYDEGKIGKDEYDAMVRRSHYKLNPTLF